jgi:hypothetical protein
VDAMRAGLLMGFYNCMLTITYSAVRERDFHLLEKAA